MQIEHWRNLSLEDIDGEVWIPIKGYEGLYEISNMGRVKSLILWKGKKQRILRQQFTRSYLAVCLGRGNNYTVHGLVATHFIDNPDNKPCRNHKN